MGNTEIICRPWGKALDREGIHRAASAPRTLGGGGVWIVPAKIKMCSSPHGLNLWPTLDCRKSVSRYACKLHVIAMLGWCQHEKAELRFWSSCPNSSINVANMVCDNAGLVTIEPSSDSNDGLHQFFTLCLAGWLVKPSQYNNCNLKALLKLRYTASCWLSQPSTLFTMYNNDYLSSALEPFSYCLTFVRVYNCLRSTLGLPTVSKTLDKFVVLYKRFELCL